MGALCVLGPLGHCPALRVRRKGDPFVLLPVSPTALRMPSTTSATVLSLMRFSQLLKYRAQLCLSEIVKLFLHLILCLFISLCAYT